VAKKARDKEFVFSSLPKVVDWTSQN